MAPPGVTIVLEHVPRPLFAALMQAAAREGLPLESYARNLLATLAERPDPLDIVGHQHREG